MSESEREYSVPLDIVDAAVDACLSRYHHMPSYVEFQRQPKTSGSVVFRLWQEDRGDLGTVTVRKVGPESTRLEVGGPPWKHRDPKPEELAEVEATLDPEVKRKTRAALMAKIVQEAQDLYHLRTEHQRLVIQDLLFKLGDDPALASAKTTPTRGSEDETDLPSYVAKTKKIRQERHKPIYRLWLEMKKEYKDEVGFSDIDKPTVEGLRDRAIQTLDLKYSARRLGDIIKAGDEDYLK